MPIRKHLYIFSQKTEVLIGTSVFYIFFLYTDFQENVLLKLDSVRTNQQDHIPLFASADITKTGWRK